MWSSTFVTIIIDNGIHFWVVSLVVLIADFDMFHVNFYIKVYIMLPNFEKTPLKYKWGLFEIR